MTEPYVAEIRIFAGNFAPTGNALCDGQILPISQNTALFSLLGTNFGGDGKSNFGLPNLQGAAPLHQGQGPGLSSYVIGETGGETAVSLIQAEMPSHAHGLQGTATTGDHTTPSGNVLAEAKRQKFATNLYASTLGNAPATGVTLETTGSSQPHNNMPPYLTLNFIIALQGVYPPRS